VPRGAAEHGKGGIEGLGWLRAQCERA
jgi:hypothetical protein